MEQVPASPPLSSWPTVNALWGALTARTLRRLGLRQVVISPGSRSSPLALAFAAEPGLECLPVLDERSASFLALGLALRGGRPTALLCTSGTAAANYLPAVVEARESGWPLLLLTADRPAEMRHCHAGQAIDQLKLYGDYPVFQAELAVPEAGEGLLRYLRQTLAHAWRRSLGPVPGPVHLNFPLREPLVPTGRESPFAFDLDRFLEDLEEELPPRGFTPAGSGAPVLPAALRRARSGVIVVGPVIPADPEEFARAVGAVAAAWGWPVLSDALNPLRAHPALVPGLVTTYDILLRQRALSAELTPDAVLQIGPLPTSKALRGWLERAAPPTAIVGAGAENHDPLHRPSALLAVDLAALADRPAADRPAPSRLAARWADRQARALELLEEEWTRADPRFEGRLVDLLGRGLPPGAALFLANSMPVRDAEYFARPGAWPGRVYFNRGANGIDGTLSTALGVAHGGPPTFLLSGDLAFLHDTNGLLTAHRLRGSLTAVVINNRGGGIFEHLPVASAGPAFEEFFATPQAVDFARLAAAYGVPHVLLRDADDLRARLAEPVAPGFRIWEIPTDRRADAAFRKALFARLTQALA